MSLATPLPSPGPVPALASSRLGAGPSPEDAARLAWGAPLRDALARIDHDGAKEGNA